MGKRQRQRSRAAQAAAIAGRDLEPLIRGGLALSAEVVATRLEAAADHQRLHEILQPRIDGHLLACQEVLDALSAAHAEIAETMAFGMGDSNRWTAVWEMSGRCIGLSACLLSQLKAGFASESVPTMRAIHEAGWLLGALMGPGEEALLIQWLDDTAYVKASKARGAETRINKPHVAALREAGIELQGGGQEEIGAQIYDMLSSSAHNRRRALLESFSVPLKQYVYGPHPNPRMPAVHVEFGSQLLEEVTLRVGIALGTRFLGQDFYSNTIRPLQAALHAVRDEMPLDPATVHAL